jgi:hypothetical protein
VGLFVFAEARVINLVPSAWLCTSILPNLTFDCLSQRSCHPSQYDECDRQVRDWKDESLWFRCVVADVLGGICHTRRANWYDKTYNL